MSNYTKATNFASKDALTTGNPLKTVSGTEIDDEYTAIATAVATKANASNAALTGVPVAPTATTATNTTQVATTAFVQANDALQANLASPTFTGVPAAPTAAADTNTTQIATTAFVTTEANLKADLAGAAFTGAITTTSTVDGVDIASRDGVLSTTTTTANAALPKAGGALTGALTTNSTIDGRDVAADGVLATNAMPQAGGAFTGAVTTNSTIDGRDVAADGVLATNALPKGGGTLTGDVLLEDNVELQFGDSGDFYLRYGANSNVMHFVSSNDLTWTEFEHTNGAGGFDKAIRYGDGSGAAGATRVDLFYDNLVKLATDVDGITVYGDIEMPVDGKLTLGSANGVLNVYFDGEDAYLDTRKIQSGDTYIRAFNYAGVLTTNAKFDGGSNYNAVWLYYNGTAKFYTTSYGSKVLGDLICTGSATATSHITSSDYRLKTNVTTVSDAATRVNALKPVSYEWIASGERVDGFLAHELAEVIPSAASGTKDAVDDEGEAVMQGIDHGKIVPLLTAALQEALATIASLDARLTAIEGA